MTLPGLIIHTQPPLILCMYWLIITRHIHIDYCGILHDYNRRHCPSLIHIYFFIFHCSIAVLFNLYPYSVFVDRIYNSYIIGQNDYIFLPHFYSLLDEYKWKMWFVITFINNHEKIPPKASNIQLKKIYKTLSANLDFMWSLRFTLFIVHYLCFFFFKYMIYITIFPLPLFILFTICL